MYDRSIGERELSFEPSGGLERASLVMRDRETDSWWSLMRSKAIAGPLQGTEIHELPVGEKTTWGDWRSRHPQSQVLSINGVEHDDSNPYDAYFTSEKTFRDISVDDDRLAPKAAIYAFRVDERAFAIPHDVIEGGRVVEIADQTGVRYFFHRPAGAVVYRSTAAFALPASAAEGIEPASLLARIAGGGIPGAERLDGFDTFWYTWVTVNPGTILLR